MSVIEKCGTGAPKRDGPVEWLDEAKIVPGTNRISVFMCISIYLYLFPSLLPNLKISSGTAWGCHPGRCTLDSILLDVDFTLHQDCVSFCVNRNGVKSGLSNKLAIEPLKYG